MLRALILAGALLASSDALADSDSIPAAMRGMWARDASACSANKDYGRVLIDEHRVELAPEVHGIGHQSYTLYVRETDADGTVHAGGLRNDEGNAGMVADTMTLKLIDGGRLQIDDPDHTYVRCSSL